jgi:hypothetical protein
MDKLLTFKEWSRSITGRWHGDKPRIFYRGTNPGDERRIKTGLDSWDGLFFAADNILSAKSYGEEVIKIIAKPDAKILYEGTKEFVAVAKGIPKKTNMLVFCNAVAQQAKMMGYDAVWFERQTDIGTAIINKDKFTVENI